MFASIVFLFVVSWFPLGFGYFDPTRNTCLRKESESGIWWERYLTGHERCETLKSGEECGVCRRNSFVKEWKENICYHENFAWKFNYFEVEKIRGKIYMGCMIMNHCEESFAMYLDDSKKNWLNYVCGTVDGQGRRVQKGECKSVYGTYYCECYPPYRGRDCNDVGPEGEYATGVQAVLETQVRVSNMMTIMVAVKDKGKDFKVHVNSLHLGVVITITEPTIDDPSSDKIIKYCEENTNLKDQCQTYLEGSTSMYCVRLRFPLVRDNRVWHYLYKGGYIEIPIGYFTIFIITTTNTVHGSVKETFYRTNYDRRHNVFVNYPYHISCYKNPKITNCRELQEKVNIYYASTAIVVYGDLPQISLHHVFREDDTACYYKYEYNTKWKLWKVMPDGRFIRLDDDVNAKDAFEFVIKPYSFKNGMYAVEFSYTMENKWETAENFDQCFFTAVEAPLVAFIEGGKARYVGVETRIILDGRKSKDPNLPSKKDKSDLTFKWSCTLDDTQEACLVPHLDSSNYIKLPPSVLEPGRKYVIKLRVTKIGKQPAFASQVLLTASMEDIQSMGIECINCMEENIANPTDYIYLLAKTVLKPNAIILPPFNYTWTFSKYPVYPPDSSVEGIRVKDTSQYLLKIDKYKLEYNQTYCFRAAFSDNHIIFAEIDIQTPQSKLICSLTPDSGIVAVTNFSLNCSTFSGLTIEVYDKSSNDPNYFSGRMLFTDLESNSEFKLVNNKVVVYAYNEYKMIEEWSHEVKLTPFDGLLKDIDDIVKKLEHTTISNNQTRFHSASVIPGALSSDMDWSSINLLNRLISLVYQVKFEATQHTKLVLSSIEFILVVMSKINTKREFKLNVEAAKKSADVISALASSLFEAVKTFDGQRTLTEAILHQMINSHLNAMEIVLSVKCSEVLSKPLYFVNPYTLRMVKETTDELVDALYKLSACLLWRQIQGDTATEIVSSDSKISYWAIVHQSEVLYRLRKHNQSIPFNFSVGFYKIMKNLDVLGIQLTSLNVNPFWWAGGDINTNLLLVDICFKTTPTECMYQRTFYKAPIFLYFNISQIYDSIKPLKIQTVALNLTKHPRELDLQITVYRFVPPLRAKLFIQFEFENPTDFYRVLFSINKRPDFDMMSKKGITVNNENQSTVAVKYLKYIKDDHDKLIYMGIYPVLNGSAGIKKNVSLKIVYAVCKTWLKWKWGSQRCWVGEQETDERTLRCDCNHLSMFAGAVQVPLYALNPALEFMLFLTEEYNWLPLIVLIIIFIVFTILYVWGWRKDKRDLIKGLVKVLDDNYPGERFAYLIGVYTGSRINASTDANVGIKLFGDTDISRAHILRDSSRSILRANSDDWFLLYSPVHLGTLESLHIWHDNSGKSPDWFIEKIEVYDLADKFEYIFDFNIWLALGVNEYPDAVAATSSLEEFFSVRRVFLSNVVTGFRDTHYWTSILWKHPRNPVKRVHRMSVVLCYILVAMICSVIFYHFNKGEEYKEDEPSYNLNSIDLVIFIISLLVASFAACLLMFLFRKSFSHKYVRMQSSVFIRPEVTSKSSVAFFSQRQSRSNFSQMDTSKRLSRMSAVSLYDSTKPRFIEISKKNVDEKFISLGLRAILPSERSMCENFAAALHAVVRGSTLEPVRLPKYSSNEILHKKYFITAWMFVLVVIIGAILVVIFFGHQIPKVESAQWVTIFICVLLFDAFILSTIKILLCSLILGCVFQRLVPASNYQLKPQDGINKNLVGDIDHLFKIARIRNHTMYCPLNDNVKELKRQESVKRKQWRTLIDFCVILLLILVLVMLTLLFTTSLYSANHAAWMLIKGPSLNHQNFSNIYNKTLFQDFLLNSFKYQLHRYLWYNQEIPLNDGSHLRRRSWTYDCTKRLLGSARIRQLRVTLGECSDLKYFENMSEYCSPPWSSKVEDTDTYSSRWYIGGSKDQRRKSTAWRYTSPTHSNSSESYGVTLTKYPSGGFIEDLGFEKDDTEGALASLFPQNWLDHMTRAVFVELTLYNVNTRLFTQVILLAEQMPTGQYLVGAMTESVATDFRFDIWMFSFSVFSSFFLVRTCVSINRRGLFVYFSEVINIFDCFLLAVMFLTLFFYVIHLSSSSNYVQNFQRSGYDEFFNFSNIISYVFWSRTLFCILFVCVVLRMLVSLRFGRIFFTFYYTFLLSLAWIVWLVLYFILYLVVIWRFVGYLLNLFIFPYYTSVIIYNKDSSAGRCEDYIYCKVLVCFMCFLSYFIILLFISSFSYYYKVAKIYKLLDTDNLNFFVFLKEMIIKNKTIK